MSQSSIIDIPPKLIPILVKIFDAKQKDAAEQGPHTARAGYYGAVWTIFMGSAAFARLAALPGTEMVVGRTFTEPYGDTRIITRRVRERTTVSRWTMLGIPIREDPNGPLDMWRVAEATGETVVWGEWTE